MPNLNERVFMFWENTAQLMSNKEAKASFLQQIDTNQDGKVTAAEITKMADENKDGNIDASELERLAIKAKASDFDMSTIKALAQSAQLGPQLVLFETITAAKVSEEKPVANPVEPNATVVEPTQADSTSDKSHAQAAAPPALLNWKASENLEHLKESFRTAISFQPGNALPSRNPDALKVVKAGLFRLQEQVGNSCGTTSLSMTLKYWQGHTLENTVTSIDGQIRANGSLELNLPAGKKNIEIDGFTAPRDIVTYAKTHGMRAGLKNQASVSDLKGYLDKGVPLMCLTDWHFAGGSYERPAGGQPDGKSLHWVDIIGYEYQTNPETKKQEMYLLVGNPWGVVQHVSESDFAKVWSHLELEIPGGKRVNTGMDRLFVAMVPRDDERPVVSPSGSVIPAGNISIPSGDDGIKGWFAKKTSDVLQDVSEIQKNMGIKRAQLASEMASGYDHGGVIGAIKNLMAGDQKELAHLLDLAKNGDYEAKADIINQLMVKGLNRDSIQHLVFDILRETPSGKEFDRLITKLDTAVLASKLENDQQAGQVLAWIAKSEVDSIGQTGSKFEAFATQLAVKHRNGAVLSFISESQVVKNQLVHKVPASLVRDAVRKLMQGIQNSSSETAILELLKACSWSQFDQITSRLNLAQLASELHNDAQLGDLAGLTLEKGIKTGNWDSFSEVLTHLSAASQYTRADNVLGQALSRPEVRAHLINIPKHLRVRIIDLMDDPTRWRNSASIEVLSALKTL